jgi:hypothetical protein
MSLEYTHNPGWYQRHFKIALLCTIPEQDEESEFRPKPEPRARV